MTFSQASALLSEMTKEMKFTKTANDDGTEDSTGYRWLSRREYNRLLDELGQWSLSHGWAMRHQGGHLFMWSDYGHSYLARLEKFRNGYHLALASTTKGGE